ncbi:bifunctional homocysteine S-methyltransferase/methylenetetrahydrofolate reductase [Paenibacillus sp. YN15]|uniref:bifunctional homocysteine S-methyltransferase/methylenetetrahydrofolate reductase n=1 Tax=Paenibacillus sp. YN15 TaxID=1742774 RepID=UPI000DCC474A|nr:bifunctional homocysteine S-methyltransferase/methylenetetrahydrofolate reductase [Paenibacillus sp. YN15]RAU92948.1 bifunctional homocysteine S-methyltransferase/methylenetetrahydrofolate reductase [Paenibacillus sp. YN15]
MGEGQRLPDLREALLHGRLTGDGAMGTYLYQLGFPVGASYEEFNLEKPDIILDIHRRYVEAGAQLVETNTYSANRDKLSKFGLEQDVAAINRAGVRLAREAAGDAAYVLGAIGSLAGGRKRPAGKERVRQNVREQAEALLEEGVDGIILETYYLLEELEAALEAVRLVDGRVPVICQLATDGNGLTLDGAAYAAAFKRLLEGGADVAGFNCHSGPGGILRALDRLGADSSWTPGVPLSVYPNAGLPGIVDGRYTYLATPEYFADMALKFAAAGARIIGGCCGTTPEHIAAIAKALAGYAPAPASGGQDKAKAERREKVTVAEPSAEAPASGGQPSIVELVRDSVTVIVELDSPRDLASAKFMTGAAVLRDAGADAITMADNSLAQIRMSNLAMGYLVKDRLGMRPLLHVACRDRNLIGTQSHLMGLHALGIDHLLAITGDPAGVGDLPGASSVYDLNSFELIRMSKQLNEGIAFSGKPLKQRASFVVGSAFDPNVKYIDKAVLRMEKKIEAGADYFMTQPVYDASMVERLYQATRHISAPIFVGIMPLISGRNAEFLHNEVPGIRIPDAVRSQMAGLEGEEGRRMGVKLAKELVDVILGRFNGIYLMTPMLFYEMTAELTRYAKERVFPLVPLSKMN